MKYYIFRRQFRFALYDKEYVYCFKKMRNIKNVFITFAVQRIGYTILHGGSWWLSLCLWTNEKQILIYAMMVVCRYFVYMIPYHDSYVVQCRREHDQKIFVSNLLVYLFIRIEAHCVEWGHLKGYCMKSAMNTNCVQSVFEYFLN